MKRKRQSDEEIIERFEPEIDEGLTLLQVKQREKQGLSNKFKQKSSKSVFRILFDNICTFFNLIWLIIFIALISVESYQNLLFVIVVCLNTIIAVVQEIKAKITVEKLKMITTPKITAIREGKQEQIYSSKIVLDDILKLSVGNQIPADCVLIEGHVEVNESLLTGESKAIKKKIGDTLLGGSFITSGLCYVRVNKVGKDCYIQTIASQAKKFKSPSSNLFKDLNAIIKYIGIMIIPVGILMFFNNYFSSGKNINVTIVKTCGSLIGMIPAGMFLLITIALAVGVIKLAQKKTLVQDIYSIEMLARTNILCLDKTGTITDGTMQVKEVLMLDKTEFDFEEVMGNFLSCQDVHNATSRAFVEHFGCVKTLKMCSKIEFSSERKFSAVCFENVGTIAMGAPEFLGVKLSKSILSKIKKRAINGERVLLVVHSKKTIENDKLIDVKPIALVVIEDHIRPDAIETIEWFKNNNVEIKIISGDAPTTVSAIAKRVGVENADKTISLEGMSLEEVEKIASKFTVFGRVSPEQKHMLIKSLKKAGNVVAMTGDGVNDTLALKEADCSISMADGSDVARSLSHLVLLNSKFSSLPAVVKEGRQVVNNVQQSSTLYLMKTFFTITLSLISLITLSAYPFQPSQLYLLELFVIGLPSIILALQPNDKIIKGNFIMQVLKNSIPYGSLLLFNVLVVMIIKNFVYLNVEEYATLSTLVLTTIGFLNLTRLCFPFNKLRLSCLGISFILILMSAALIPGLFGFYQFSLNVILIYLVLTILSSLILIFVPLIRSKIISKHNKFDVKN